MAKKAPNPKAEDPSTTSEAYDVMCPRWDLMRSVLGGTETMRAAGEAYLPRHDNETQTNWDSRLASATFLNMVEHTLESLVGKPFSEPLQLDEGIPETSKALFDDIDLQGNNLSVFCKNWFKEGLAKAFCHVLVEFPRKPEGTLTKEQEQAANLRPYWVLVKPECLRAARFEMVNGVETLVHARIMETYQEVDGFAEVTKRRIRVVEPGTVKLYVPVEKKGKTIWEQDDEWTTGRPVVPVVTWYSSKEGFMLGKPPLLDQAHLNVTHWQSQSDQRHILTVVRFPILACSGAGEDSDDITIGPNKVLYNKSENGRFYYVEHTGSAIAAGRTDLQDLESQLAGYGAQFLKKRPGTETATAAAIDSAEAKSQLEAWTQTFADAIGQALYFTALWQSKEATDGGKVVLSTSWADAEEPVKDPVAVLQQLRRDREISRKAYLEEAKERGILSEEYDSETDLLELAKESYPGVTPQMLQMVLSLAQANKLSFTELRDFLRKCMLATQKDEAAKDEMEQTIATGPGPNATGTNPPGTPIKEEPTPPEEAPAEEPTPPEQVKQQ